MVLLNGLILGLQHKAIGKPAGKVEEWQIIATSTSAKLIKSPSINPICAILLKDGAHGTISVHRDGIFSALICYRVKCDKQRAEHLRRALNVHGYLWASPLIRWRPNEPETPIGIIANGREKTVYELRF